MFWKNRIKLPPNKSMELNALTRACLTPISRDGRLLPEGTIIIAIEPQNKAKLLSCAGQEISKGELTEQISEALERATGLPSSLQPRSVSQNRPFLLSWAPCLFALVAVQTTLLGYMAISGFRQAIPVSSQPPIIPGPQDQGANSPLYTRLQNSIQSGAPISESDYALFPEYLQKAINEAGMTVSGRPASKRPTPHDKSPTPRNTPSIQIIKDDGARPDPASSLPGEDAFGISNLPPPHTTASTGNLNLPMPGGNDFRSRTDAKKFGLGDFPSDIDGKSLR